MSVVCRISGKLVVITKGGFDTLASRCTDGLTEKAANVVEEMSRQALRVLAVACKVIDEVPEEVTSETLEHDLTLIGLVGMIDPPREGAMALCRSLADTDKRPARLVYVSCNPATLARDAALLVREGGWKLLSAGVMNMFPHTAHVESIAVFEPGPKPEKIDEIDEIEIGGMTEEAEQEARSEEPKI